MGKSLGEIGKIIITALVSCLMTFVVLTQTTLGGKADIEYVDKQDNEIKLELRKNYEDLKKDFIREIDKMNESLKIITDKLINDKS